MGRLSEVRVIDPVLTELARGYSNAEMVAEHLFPLVENLAKEAGTIPQWGKDAFKLYNTLRAIRAASNRKNPKGTTPLSFSMDEHDLEYPIDHREASESMFDLEQIGNADNMANIQLRREKTAADLALNPANYATENKITLSGTSQFTDGANSDPVGVVEDGKEAIRAKIGRRPNTMVIGPQTFKSLKVHPALIEKIKYSQKGILTVELLKEIFDMKDLTVGEAIYADDDGAFHDIWFDSIVLGWVPGKGDNLPLSPFSPSYGYTLRRKGMPESDSYEEGGGKLKIVRTTDIYDVVLVGAEAGYLITDTNG